MCGQGIQLRIGRAGREDGGILLGDSTATLPLEGTGHDGGPTGRLAVTDLFIDERDELIGEPNGDLSGHTKTVPGWDWPTDRCAQGSRLIGP